MAVLTINEDVTLLLLVRFDSFSNTSEMSLLSASFMNIQKKKKKKKPEEATLFTRSIMAILTMKGTYLCHCWSDLTTFRSRLRFHACYCYIQVS